MPNHVNNVLTIKGTEEQVNEVKVFIKDENEDLGSIDFNKITPMPKWVYRGDLSVVEESKYGKENCWYEWCIKNWGTKWNAYRSSPNQELNNIVEFVTAWASPVELIQKLSWIFPHVELEIAWSDPYGTQGVIGFKDGEILSSHITESRWEEIQEQGQEHEETFKNLINSNQHDDSDDLPF